jgi:hypothetical protein
MLLKVRYAVLIFICVAAVFALAAKEFVPPRVFHAKTYPARDEHPSENVTIAADPYDMPDKAAIFTVPFREAGFLPINLIISNDGDRPVTLTGMRIEFITADRTKITPATAADVQRRFAGPQHRGGAAPRSPLPIPLPRGSSKRPNVVAGEEFSRAKFMAKAVEPHANQGGFLFFDVQDIPHPLAGAHIYIYGLRDGKGQELMFFDIPMEKYLTYRPVGE